MNTNTNAALTAAAQDVVDRWDTPAWKAVEHTAVFINRLRAALTTAAAVPPEGWVMVPVEPTPEIVKAIDGVMWPGASEKAYRAMLAAAPKAEPVPAGGYPPLPEPLEINWPELHSHALGCGVEDRGLRDRYECAEYGWQDGVDKAVECVPDELYDADQMRAYIDADRAMRAQAAPATVAGPSCSHVGSEGWRFHAEDMERQRDHYRHRAQTMDDHQRGECWYWMGDGNDHPESLANSLPVVIRADALRALITAAPTTQAAPAHPDDAAVDALAATMKAKLAKQRAKGYGGWDTPECTQQRLSDMLREHVAKGDPVDVANFCAFLAARCEGIAQAAPQPAVQQGDAELLSMSQALFAQREADARDAARYRWWCDTGNDIPASATIGGKPTIDAAIDAARSHAKEGA